MTKLTTLDLSPLYRNSIGIDNWISRVLDQIDHTGQTNYPPYNIILFCVVNRNGFRLHSFRQFTL